MDPSEIYRGNAVIQKSPVQTTLALFGVAIIWGLTFAVAKLFWATWVFELAAIAVSAVLINRILKQGTFTMTYVLYDDRLEVITRYGFIEKVTATYILSDTVFEKSSIKSNGKTYPFYPDERLKQLLKIETAS